MGNFVKCTTRFDGRKSTDIETFISTIEIYKECASVTKEIALKSLPILLTDESATLWLGIKITIKS